MSTSDPIQPYPTEPGGSPAGPVVPPKPPRNTIGLIGLIVAILGFAFAVIEGAYLLGWLLLPVGFILGLVGLFARDRKKGVAVAAVIVSIVGTIAGAIAFTSSLGRVVDEEFQSGTTTVLPSAGASPAESQAGAAPSQNAGKRTIELKVNSERGAQVTYSTGSGTSNEQTTGAWNKTLETDESFTIISVSAINADFMKENSITCEILVDGESVSQQSGNGKSAMATCSATIS